MKVKPNGKVDYIELNRKTGKPLVKKVSGRVKEGWPVDVRQAVALGDAQLLEPSPVVAEVKEEDLIPGNDPDMTKNPNGDPDGDPE